MNTAKNPNIEPPPLACAYSDPATKAPCPTPVTWGIWHSNDPNGYYHTCVAHLAPFITHTDAEEYHLFRHPRRAL